MPFALSLPDTKPLAVAVVWAVLTQWYSLAGPTERYPLHLFKKSLQDEAESDDSRQTTEGEAAGVGWELSGGCEMLMSSCVASGYVRVTEISKCRQWLHCGLGSEGLFVRDTP